MSERDVIATLDAEVAKLRGRLEKQTEALKVAYDFALAEGAVNMASLFRRAWEDETEG